MLTTLFDRTTPMSNTPPEKALYFFFSNGVCWMIFSPIFDWLGESTFTVVTSSLMSTIGKRGGEPCWISECPFWINFGTRSTFRTKSATNSSTRCLRGGTTWRHQPGKWWVSKKCHNVPWRWAIFPWKSIWKQSQRKFEQENLEWN